MVNIYSQHNLSALSCNFNKEQAATQGVNSQQERNKVAVRQVLDHGLAPKLS